MSDKFSYKLAKTMYKIFDATTKGYEELLKVLIEIQTEDRELYEKVRDMMLSGEVFPTETLESVPPEILARLLQVYMLMNKIQTKMATILLTDVEEKKEVLENLKKLKEILKDLAESKREK